jgi:periplasmic protein TonB
MYANSTSLNPVAATAILPWTINQSQRPVAIALVVIFHLFVGYWLVQYAPSLAGIAMIKQPQLIAVSLMHSRESNAIAQPLTTKHNTPQKPPLDKPAIPTQATTDAPSDNVAAVALEITNVTPTINSAQISQNKPQTPTATPARVDADYLDNPAPLYPAISKRVSEQGSVILRVLVTTSGTAGEIEIKDSSGFPRLDRAAIDAVKRWKFIAASDGVMNISAWVIVPIHFSLRG